MSSYVATTGSLATVLLIAFQAAPARAEQDPADAEVWRDPAWKRNNRIGLGLGVIGVMAVAGNDGIYEAGHSELVLKAQYAYRPARFVEVGVDANYWFINPTTRSTWHFFMPGLRVRPYVDLDKARTIELGVSLHAYVLLLQMTSEPGTWSGWGLGIGPDVRKWLTSNFGVECGLMAAIGDGHNSRIAPGGELHQDASVLLFGPWAGSVVRF